MPDGFFLTVAPSAVVSGIAVFGKRALVTGVDEAEPTVCRHGPDAEPAAAGTPAKATARMEFSSGPGEVDEARLL